MALFSGLTCCVVVIPKKLRGTSEHAALSYKKVLLKVNCSDEQL